MRPEQDSSRPSGPGDEREAGVDPRGSLTRREREILGLLAEGMSGAQIAEKLVLSPETVRTHVRNARSKLGATTRSQAVALALRQNAIAGGAGRGPAAEAGAREAVAINAQRALARLLGRLLDLHDVDHAAAYVAEEDGLSLRLAADAGADGGRLPEEFALGEGALGRAALERRVQVTAGAAGPGALIAAPIVARGRLFGVLAFEARISRPVGRNEMLLLRAFATRVGEVLAEGEEVERRLDRAAERFRASWSAGDRGG